MAYEETWTKLRPELSADQLGEFDALLDFDAALGATPLVWLCQQAAAPVPDMVREQVVKLERLRQLGIAKGTVATLPANRVRHLARQGQRHTPQALRRLQPERRYQIVACTLADLTTSVTDEVLELFDSALGTTDRRARTALERRRKTKTAATRSIVAHFEQIGAIVMDAEISDTDLRSRILDAVGAEELRTAVEESADILVPESLRHLDELKARYSQLRQHAPHVIAAFDFIADQPDSAVVEALRTLKHLNNNGLRRVPEATATAFEDSSQDRALRQQVTAALPEISLIELLVEVNSWCGFLDQFTHAGNATNRSEHHSARLLATIMANGCNLGIADMARSSAFTEDQLDWTQTWHLRSETVAAANNAIVNHHHKQPLTKVWGNGTLSSSDGQRFPFAVRNPKARSMRRYFTGTGATVYTWTADHHIQYGTRVIPTTVREATYVLDAILDNETDLTIEEHTTDTAGYTDLVFGLFDLCGLRFSPRLRDLSDQRLWRLPTTPQDTPASRLIQHRIRPALIETHWADMQRVAATIRSGHTSASLLVSRLQASARQNELTKAIQEYGRLIKTISTLRYLHDSQHRRRIHRQLNKGESLHALRRRLFFANLGQLMRRRSEDQDVQAQCLTLITNAIIAWNTTYLDAALDHMDLPNSVAEHLAPSMSRHIHLYGQYDFTTPKAPENGTLRPLNGIVVTQP